MRASRWLWLALLGVFTLCYGSWAQEGTPPSAGQGEGASFTRTATSDPALPPVSMLTRLLALTPEQEQKIRQIYAQHNQRYGELLQQKISTRERQEKLRQLRREMQKQVDSVLTPQQLHKLRTLEPEAILVDRLTVALKLTPEQSTQLLEVMREQTAAIRAIEKQARENGWSEQQKREKMAELRKQTDEKVNRILTPEQQQRLKQILQGEPEKPTSPPPQEEQKPAP